MKSVAETTISRHKPLEPFIWQEGTCYGCAGQHKFMRYGKIVCPNGERPGVEKIAAENRREHIKLMELRQGERDRRTTRSARMTVTAATPGTAKMIAAPLAMQVLTAGGSPDSTRGP